MNEYDFTLRFRLATGEEDAEQHLGRLEENGCSDALIGIGKPGRISLNFTREADNALSAITSAITDVKQAIPHAVLVESTPDFVGITDIAELYGTSRQYIRKVMLGQAATFPEPVHEGKPSLWHLADVLDWVMEHEPERFNPELSEVSKRTMQINLYRTYLKTSPTDFSLAHQSADAPQLDRLLRFAFGYAGAPGTMRNLNEWKRRRPQN